MSVESHAGSANDNEPTFAALVYHNVGVVEHEVCRGLTVLPDAFRSQIRALKAMGYKTILPREWLAYRRGEFEIPSRAVAITFDDAYQSIAELALPELDRAGFRACIFVPTSLPGRALRCNQQDAHALPVMSAEQIATWAGRGFEFGGHSRTHADLTAAERGDLAGEIDGCRQDLARMIDGEIMSFAYPFGRFDDATLDLVSASYQAAFTLEEGLNELDTPVHLLRRTMVQHNDSIADVCLRARFGRSVLSALRTRVRAAATPLLGATRK